MESSAQRPAAQEHGAFPLRAVGYWNGTLERIHDALYVTLREAAGKEASPTTAIIDSQSAKAAQKGARRSIRKDLTPAIKSRGASAR